LYGVNCVQADFGPFGSDVQHVVLRELSSIDDKTLSTDEVQTTRGTDANHLAFGSSPLEEHVDENRTGTQATTIPKCKCQLLTKENVLVLTLL
jgi:hypothetical protein